MPSFISNALQAAGASSIFWIVLATILVVALVGYLLTRRGDGFATTLQGEKARVIQDWVPTGRIDFSGPAMDPSAADKPASFYLQVEETRILVSLSGIERKEIRWRGATLNEAKRVVNVFHRQLPRSAARAIESEAASATSSDDTAGAKTVVDEKATPASH